MNRTHNQLGMSESQQSMDANDYELNEKLGYAMDHLNSSEFRNVDKYLDMGQDVSFEETGKGEDLPMAPVWFDVLQTVTSFTGREEELEVIADNMDGGIVVVCGLSGIGKSELVMKYARSQYNERRSVVWIDATTRDSTVRSFGRLAKDKLDIGVKGKGLRAMLDEVYKYLNSVKCLLIFDNAEKYNSLDEFLPFGSFENYFILITSRNALEWKSESREIKVLLPLKVLTKMEAVQFVKKIMETSTDDNTQSEAIALLVEKLYYFPLVIKRITEYIQNENVTRMKRNSEFKISDYLKSLEKGSCAKHKIMHEELIASIWQVTADNIDAEEYRQDAMDMLNIISYFEPNNIHLEVFTNHWPYGDKSRMSTALTLVQKYCIISLDNEMITIHGFVKEAIRLKIRKLQEDILKNGLLLFKDLMASNKSIKSYIPHIMSLWNYAKGYHKLIERFIVDDARTSTYFHLIAGCSNDDVVKAILDSIEKQHPDKLLDVINARDRKGKTALHYAIRGGNECNINLIIEKGANLNASDHSYLSPLHLAAGNGLDAVVKVLLEGGACVNLQNIESLTPLHFASQNGHKQVVISLLKAGAAVNAQTMYKSTSLHLASRAGHFGVVSILLYQASVQIEAENEYKLTALHLAAQSGHLGVVQILLNKGANINALARGCFTPLHLAAQRGYVDVVNELLHNIKVNFDAQTSQTGVQIEAENEYKLTALHLAAQGGHLGVVQILLNKGANINALDRGCFTPLHLAAQRGYVDVVNELLQNIKVNFDAQTSQGNTPLHLASENGHIDIVRALFENNAYCEHCVNMDGRTALDLAVERNHLDINEYVQRRHTLDSNKLEDDHFLDKSKDQVKTYEKTASSIDGELYEIRLLTLLLLMGFSEEVHSFNLASNMKQAHKLDNIVLKCKYNGTKIPKFLFLQAKHRKDVQTKGFMEGGGAEKSILTINNLFSNSGANNFSLVKYFDSYLKIRQQFSPNKVNDPIFGNRYYDLDCDFVIYTNAEAALNADGNCIGEPMVGIERVIVERENILNFSTDETKPYVYYRILRGKNKYLDEKIDTLKQVSNSEADITEFLNKFKLFVGQPNTNELSEIIKHRIRHAYRVKDEDIPRVFPDVESRVLKWWNEETHYLTKDNRFLQDAIRIDIKFDVKEPVPRFTGRVKLLIGLHEILQNEGWTGVSQTASVTGLGGIGKSELARKYISIYSSEYDRNIVWINASSFLTIDQSFRKLAKDVMKIQTKGEDDQELNIENIIPEIYKYFTERQRKSLFVFDDATKYKTLERFDDSIDKFLPTGPSKPHILITSRVQEWADIKPLPLDVFTQSEAVEFILKALNNGTEVSVTEARKLGEQLQYFPLALTQAVAYIQCENYMSQSPKTFTITDYLAEYEKKALDLLQEPLSNEIHNRYTGTVFTTWTVTIDKIKEKKYGQMALYILNILAYFASDNIPIDDIFCMLEKNTEIRHHAVDLLNQYSMAHLEHGMLKVHSLVQQVTRVVVEKQGQEEGIVKKAYTLLTQSFPFFNNSMEGYARKQKLLSHIEGLLKSINKFAKKPEYEKMMTALMMMTDNFEIARRPVVNLSTAFGKLSKHQKEKALLERAYAIEEKHYGPNNYNLGETIVKLAIVNGILGDNENAIKLLERALKMFEDHYGPDHYKIATLLVCLGNTYGALGKTQKQKELLERALIMHEKFYGSDRFETAKTLVNLANAYANLGDHHKRKELVERALLIQITHFGPEHVDLATTFGCLGLAYGALGDHQIEVELLERVLEMQKRYDGTDNFEIVTNTLVNLSTAYGKLGKHQKEKKLLERAYAIEEKHHGPDNYNRVETITKLAIVNGILGDNENAIELLEEALKMFEDDYSPDHYKVASLLVCLGNTYGALGKTQKQKELLERALIMHEKFYGPDHFETAKTLVNLANAYANLGNHGKCKELVERALIIQEKHFGPEHMSP